MMDFVTLDVETANSNPKSICQVGVAIFKDGELVDSWGSLVNPKSHFDGINMAIHGITPEAVKDAPTIDQLKPKIDQLIGNNIVGIYSCFDKVAFERNFDDIDYNWLDIIMIVRRTWEKVAYSGYGLSNVCYLNDIQIGNHHDAVADAIAAGRVLVCALNAKNIQLHDYKSLIKKRIGTVMAHGEMVEGREPTNIFIEGGNPEGEWYGDVVCFTGELKLPRMEASVIASQQGFNVDKGVTKKTNYLVKGHQDLFKLKGKTISSKEEKALTLIKKGQDIVVISESDFFYMINAS